MSIPRRIELPFRVRFDECGGDGMLRDSGLLRYAQEMAWVHSERARFDRRWYRERGLTWLVRSATLDLIAPIEHGQVLHVSTEVVGWRRVWARRRSGFRDDEGRLQGEARIDWVLLGPSGSPVRVPPELAGFFTAADVGTYQPARLVLPPAPAGATRTRFGVRRRDLDPMAHVNNATYLDYAEDGLAEAGAELELAGLPRTWTVGFVRPAEPGDELTGFSWREETGWGYRLLLPSGEDAFVARLRVPS